MELRKFEVVKIENVILIFNSKQVRIKLFPFQEVIAQ